MKEVQDQQVVSKAEDQHSGEAGGNGDDHRNPCNQPSNAILSMPVAAFTRHHLA